MVTPTQIAETLLAEQRFTRVLTITNGGAGPLVFTLTESVPAGWLGITPSSGILVPLGSAAISVSLDAAGDMTWVSDTAVLNHQPEPSFMRRIEDWFLSLLPIEDEL